MRFSKEAQARIDKGQQRADERAKQREIEKAAAKLKWEKYYEQLAKMPVYLPGSKKVRSSIHNLNNS